jgi:hypothetical protein
MPVAEFEFLGHVNLSCSLTPGKNLKTIGLNVKAEKAVFDIGPTQE